LRPGGEAQIMVYHRSFWNYRVFSGLLGRIANRRQFRARSFHEASQLMTDGAIARFYSSRDWSDLVTGLFAIRTVRILGSKTGLVPLPQGRLKNVILSLIPTPVSQFLNNRMKFGNLLFSTLRKTCDS
jgi:hypothetical protein